MTIVYLFDIDIIERSEYPQFPKLPNHALMKLSSYYKNKGYSVKLIYNYKNIPIIYNEDNLYIGSALYSGNLKRFKKRLSKPLKYAHQLRYEHIKVGTPTDVCPITDLEGLQCDYSEYDKMLEESDVKLAWYPVNVGFLTRGCKRHCKFCVNRDKDAITPVNTLDEIYIKKGYDIELLDDNLFASDNAVEYLHQIADFAEKHRIYFRLRNGLDLRVKPNKPKLEALARASKYFGGYHCAWDDVRNTYIFNNIVYCKKNVPGEFVVYMLSGINIETEEELRKDLLGLFYRYYLLRRINAKPYIALFEDDTGQYVNPYWSLYKTIKDSYYIMSASTESNLKNKLSIGRQQLADKIIEILGEYSWLVTLKIKDIIDCPDFYERFAEIAKEIGVKHVTEEVMDFRNYDKEE